MKKDIHPKLYKDCKVTCACGNTFTTVSTLPSINVEICSLCHPFFTGQQKFIDTEGRIHKFQKKMKLAQEKKQEVEEKKKAKQERNIKKTNEISLKELLDNSKNQ